MTFHFAKPFYLLAVLAGLFLSVASVVSPKRLELFFPPFS